MKVIKVSSSSGSYISTELKSISKLLRNHLEQSLKSKSNEKFILEVCDINDEKLTFLPPASTNLREFPGKF